MRGQRADLKSEVASLECGGPGGFLRRRSGSKIMKSGGNINEEEI